VRDFRLCANGVIASRQSSFAVASRRRRARPRREPSRRSSPSFVGFRASRRRVASRRAPRAASNGAPRRARGWGRRRAVRLHGRFVA
jgi:hypothetical protein